MIPYNVMPVIAVLCLLSDFHSQVAHCESSVTWTCPNVTRPEDRGSLSCRELNGELVFWCSNKTGIYESFEEDQVTILAENLQNISLPACSDESDGKTANVWDMGLENDTDCGIRRSGLEMISCVNPKIVGGCPVEPQELPWLCGLLHDGEMRCGATLLQESPPVLLTAAHCVDNTKTLEIVCGAHHLTENRTFEDGEVLRILQTVEHEDYNWRTYENDIALLFVEQISLERVSAICLPTEGYTYEGWENSFVSGWGVKYYRGELESGPPRKVKHVPVGEEECEVMNDQAQQTIFHGMMCAGGEQEEDACQGDSGGPLMASSDGGLWSLIGVVSWGKRCGVKGRYGVYTRLTDYFDWIRENISTFIANKEREKEKEVFESSSTTASNNTFTTAKSPDEMEGCKIQFWCDLTSGQDPTLVIILAILICLIIALILFKIARRPRHRSSEEEKKRMFMRTETELDAFSEENEFTFLPGVKPNRNSLSPSRRSIKPKVHRIIDLEEEQSSNEGIYTPAMHTFNSIKSNQSTRTQDSLGTKTLGSEPGYSSSTIRSFLLRTRTQSSINSNPTSTSSKRKTLKLVPMTDSGKVEIVLTERDSDDSVDDRIPSSEADMDIGGMFEGMLNKDVTDGDGEDVLTEIPELSVPRRVVNRTSMTEDASKDFQPSPKIGIVRNTSLTASMRLGDYYKSSLDDHLY
eukprot:GFUD01014299.1.p1 GENE.GFUD01014299.1~~GFUD01014299.1.p1  ORF type:complete len:693 (+),score=166.52 GFUD01014299.1:3-2081(+)